MEIKYNSPGRVDNLTFEYLDTKPKDKKEVERLLKLWNEEIKSQYDNLDYLQSRFFELDFSKFPNQNGASVTWFADPAEPTFCKDISVAKRLSDWGVKGRHNLHNEYCEYSIIMRTDKTGTLRPKRVQFTTELREYWLFLAIHSPFRLKNIATSILGFEPSWQDLYGIDNPFLLTEKMRRFHFAKQTAGSGKDSELKNMGVPDQPIGELNTKNALFMTHPINGLDDLLYILMFGAHPYRTKKDGEFVKAKEEQIFREYGVEHLACRHADPAAAIGAYDNVYEGKPVGFADPIGMYIQTFKQNAFSYNDEQIPNEWVKYSRGKQRLEFGPSDSEDIYLDDLKVEENGEDVKLTGGFQIAQLIEVGPFVLIGDQTEIQEDEYVEVKASDSEIKCNEASICDRINSLENEYHRERLLSIKKSFRKIE
ncbi:hypothetical protein [uncultured Aquimarina sp.]|uniref:hypothetical protein n=1 Tax=uncultured Aquimarina sp. TaxID=575652 RepID=UPI0026034C0C|nr:hypothetical protein [uncultured Aquimarina sp.]